MKRLVSLCLVIAVATGAYFVYQEKSLVVSNDSIDSVNVNAKKSTPTVPNSVNPDNLKSGTTRKRAFLMQPAKSVAGNGRDTIEQNKANALKGNGEAAYIVFRVLQECEQQALKQGGIEEIECKGITPEEMAESEQFLKIAAEAGILEAELSYLNFASARFEKATDIAKNLKEFEQFKSDSMRYLSSAAEAGNIEGLLAMSDAYKNGMLTEKNDIKAFAYLYAVNKSGLTNSANSSLTRLSANMSQKEVEQATNLGNSLYKQCCN
jgi:TPR repeat protein